MSVIFAISLVPHPDTPCPAVSELRVRVSGRPETALVLTYELVGDLGAVRLPAPAPPIAADGLWQHTCFELFVRRDAAEAYREYNFSPSGQWAGYAFRAYRERDEAVVLPSPRLRLSRHLGCLELEAMLPPGALPASAPLVNDLAGLFLGLSAVIEGVDGSLSYWALCHPAARPDFHHRESFALSLGTPA